VTFDPTAPPAILVLCGIAYNTLAIVGAIAFRLRLGRYFLSGTLPPVSILKPIRGRDARFYEAIRSHALQRYPAEFEILFGAADPDDTKRELGPMREAE